MRRKEEKKVARRLLALLCAAFAGIVIAGCSPASEPQPEPVLPITKVRYVEQAAKVPPGVVRYCWEEPMVNTEQNGPGLDSQGHWYHPSYLAVREGRQGKWRPCRAVVSETERGVQ